LVFARHSGADAERWNPESAFRSEVDSGFIADEADDAPE